MSEQGELPQCACNGCLLSPDVVRIIGACPEDERGRKCGGAAMYELVTREQVGMEAEDVFSPVFGTFEIIKTPDFIDTGFVPKRFHDQFVGVVLPIRETPEVVDKEYTITFSARDMVFSLIGQGNREAGMWFSLMMTDHSLEPRSFILLKHDGEVTMTDPISSKEFYAQFVNEEVLNLLDSRMFTE